TNFSVANAQELPFPDDFCDIITISFGLRNVTNKNKALEEMYRVLKPKGKALILEFSHPTSTTFSKIYDFYSFNILPKIGKVVADDEDSYQYLVESIRKHPKQEKLCSMMSDAKFTVCDYENLTGGLVAIHYGIK
ncbi:MAG: ubiquinone/menaquinone biosynthesis methyltransferase, partial [Francisellaceae bacterium]|nr:ubiquinone/menaquinone biosynthesis methyltransferase [Francisellaceae bacterium]